VLLLASALAFVSLPAGVRGILIHSGVGEREFPEFVRSIESDAAEREQNGEREHLVFFVLQSAAFTNLPRIEPAESARQWKLLGEIPLTFRQRVEAFLKSPPRGERMQYLRSILPRKDPGEFLFGEYRRTMASLYQKEFEQAPDFYRKRGHSTDTDVAANYAVWSALRVMRALHPSLRLERVLVLGPGLDFAPRTGFDESHEPQSYQPFAVADALVSLDLAKLPSIHCLDLNARVVRFFSDFRLRPRPQLHLSTTAGDPEYLRYFEALGQSIGTVHAKGLTKSIVLRPQIVGQVTASLGNIVTETPDGQYDLVIATNVLIYCKDLDLLLAMSNISRALKPGGYFVSNEIRPVMDGYAAATEMAPVQARSLLIAQGKKTPLYDSFAIFQKIPQ
jgi:SAM-dependent methyltransferase